MNGNTQRICNVGIVGPYLSGKTTLLESMLFLTGAISRKGTVQDGNTVGDSAPESRSRQTSVEISVASTTYRDVRFNFIDCPGSIEFVGETDSALMGIDVAIVVCEPVVDRVLTLAPLFQFLDEWEIPHIVWLNKLDKTEIDYIELLHILSNISTRHLVPHQFPIYQGERFGGYIDLVTETAYKYGERGQNEAISFPPELANIEKSARAEMLEQLANFDDRLLEELLEDIEPPIEEIVSDFQNELGLDLIVPALVGSANYDFGVLPLLDALVTFSPDASLTASRRMADYGSDRTIAQVLKTFYTPQGGKLSLVRVWQGQIAEGKILNGTRIGNAYRLLGNQTTGISHIDPGEIVALARLEGVKTGDTLTDNSTTPPMPVPSVRPPVYALAVVAENRNDEVKLTGAMNKLIEEDPILHWEQHGDTHEVILWGQGEIHIQVALDRLRRKYNLPMATHLPQIPYKETIRNRVDTVHGRYKHQSGGHGQFGDVYLKIEPVGRGNGFSFADTIVGGVVPKQYIPGVETGVREYLERGPLGYPVVDVAVTLTNGSYHSVDSSEQAFKNAARLAMSEGMAKAKPTLLEPVLLVEVSTPNEFTAKVMQLLSGHRAQILGYQIKEGWHHWDTISACLPQAEMQNLIVELRSLTLGVGFFTWRFDHLQEVPDKLAERLLPK